MGHLVNSRNGAASTPTEWLACGATIGDFVNERARRDDIVAFLGDTAGFGAPAAFNITLAEIELNRGIVWGEHVTPAMVGSFTDRRTLFDWPVAAGALVHESGHARWTQFDMRLIMDLKSSRTPRDRKIGSVIEMFEETRMERQCVLEWPADRAFMRACALKLVVGEHDTKDAKDGNKFALSTLMLLTSARVDAGVLADEDVQELSDGFEEVFGADLIVKLRALWCRAQAVEDHRNAGVLMQPIAAEWVDLIDEFAPDEQDEDGSGSNPLPQALQDLLDQLGEMAEAAEIEATSEAMGQEQAERNTASAAATAKDAREAKELRDIAEEVFNSGKGTEDFVGSSYSAVRDQRAPTGDERRAVVLVSRELEKAKYRDRDSTTVHSVLPPGRLSTRQAVQGAAEQRQGRVSTAVPWERTVRRQTEEPTLTLGCMVDISGSMSSAMTPMAVTAYVLAAAGQRVDAKVAQVYYGNDVFSTLRVGQRMDQVTIRTSPDSTERFDRAFKALDGALNLTRGSGARLLVICSDTCYTPREVVALKRHVRECVRQRVGVLILPFDDGDYVKRHDLPQEVKVLPSTTDPAQVATQIGHAAAQALTTAGRRG